MNFKSLMLGAAAAAAATSVQAADLPVAAEPVDYVRVCDAYGARFYYIPGTETCLRVGGRVRANYTTSNFGEDNTDGFGDRADANYTFDAYGYLYLDSRTNTEFGLLRTFTEIELSSGDAVGLGKAYIQWGGLTFGHATSFFDYFTGQSFAGPVTRNWSDKTTNLIAYTAAFGNGLSATVSLEDAGVRASSNEGGKRYPDLVANLRVDQGWGSAQLSGAIHDNVSADATVDSELGWAVGAGVIVKLPMLSSGSNLAFQAQYADGALSYIGSTAANATAGDNNKGYTLSGGIYHQATSTVGLSLDGSYMDIDMGSAAADITRWAIDGSAKWVPVSGFEMGVAVGYANNEVGSTDTDEVKARFRVQRTF
ncbi:porin [Roseibium sp.]|uniref:porin n=1 Tax=Roseibium sp. TaxID=1936156 RepID=UPI003A979BA2